MPIVIVYRGLALGLLFRKLACHTGMMSMYEYECKAACISDPLLTQLGPQYTVWDLSASKKADSCISRLQVSRAGISLMVCPVLLTRDNLYF